MATTYPSLPIVETVDREVPQRVCIATWEIAGPSRNGGIGTAYASLADSLSRAGCDVTILYLLGTHCANGNISEWIQYYHTQKGVTLVPLPMHPANLPPIKASWPSHISYLTYRWLKEQDFDVIHFPECQGLAFYSLMAKRQGLAFHRSTFVVISHGPTWWVKEGNQDPIRNLGELEMDFLERTSVSLSDILVSPSRYMLDWMLQHGWNLPARTYVAPYILGPDLRSNSVESPEKKREIHDVVFFGRLEIRKGLKLFCDAIDELSVNISSHKFEITFLGMETQIYNRPSVSYLGQRARNWPISWRLITHADQGDAIEYLRKPGRIAVIASLGDNFPNSVLECLGSGVPFLCSNVGGIPEVIAPADRSKVCFDPQPEILANRIRSVLEHGAHLARPSDSFADVERQWISWHSTLRGHGKPEQEFRPDGQTVNEEKTLPVMSVCFVYKAWNENAEATLSSLMQQDYSHFEVILVGCGGNAAPPSSFLKSFEVEFQPGRLHLLSAESSAVGIGRNVAARKAEGEYLLFVDSLTILAPNAISTLVQVAKRTNADIVTSAINFFEQSSTNRTALFLRPFLGGSVTTGAFTNCFGSTNALVRREKFETVGGFDQGVVTSLDDWEFFSKAVLMGLRIETVPDPLLWYRLDRDRENPVDSFVNAIRSVRPYTLPWRNLDSKTEQFLRNALLFGQGLKFEGEVLAASSGGPGVEGPAVTG